MPARSCIPAFVTTTRSTTHDSDPLLSARDSSGHVACDQFDVWDYGAVFRRSRIDVAMQHADEWSRLHGLTQVLFRGSGNAPVGRTGRRLSARHRGEPFKC